MHGTNTIKTFVLFCASIVNDHSLFVPINAHVLLIYTYIYITLCGCYVFRLLPSSGGSQPSSLKLTAIN